MTQQPLLLCAPWNAPSIIQTRISTHGFNPVNYIKGMETTANQTGFRAQLPAEPLWLKQTHSTMVINSASYSPDNPVEADAIISLNPKQVCAVITADCLPILLSNQTGDFVAAIHAGWRGLAGGIIKNTMEQLQRFNPATMVAFIGPAIAQDCFEVGIEVVTSFINPDSATQAFFYRSPKLAHKFYADLRGIAAYQLQQLGLNPAQISNPKRCTHCLPSWFYSYRNQDKYQRIVTLIWKA
jgi:YfiH family protein